MPARIDLTGMHFEEWEVLEYVGNKKWKCRCSCGTISEVDGNSLRRGMSTSCGCKRTKENLIGRQFGTFEVIEKLPGTEWRCKCKSCGKTTTFTATELTWGKFKKCECQGDVNPFIKDDLTGRIFGDWKVLGYSGHKMWKCQCLRCGRIKDVRRNSLTMGTSTSCGCGKNQFIDLQGQVFGYLKVLEYVGDNKWKCICKCGTITYVEGKALREGRTKSCGCKFKEIRNETMLEKYGELGEKRVGKPRERWQIMALQSKDLLRQILIDYFTTNGKYPKVVELAEYLDAVPSLVWRRVRELELKEFIDHGDVFSVGEEQIIRFIQQICPGETIETHRRNLLGNSQLEIDIYLPNKRIGIEYNGSYWHSSDRKSKKYHQMKTLFAYKHKIRIIHIYDYEWMDDKQCEKLKYYLAGILTNNKSVIYAKDTTIVEFDMKDKKSYDIVMNFLDTFHLQGSVHSEIAFGLMYKSQLVGIMTFGNSRFDKAYQYELIRLAWKYNIAIVGGAEKLFSHFISKYSPKSIVSYCNISKFTGDVYKRLRFCSSNNGLTEPGYVWVEQHLRNYFTRYQAMKHKLIKLGYSIFGDTEDEIMKNMGYFKVYDCGNIKYEWIVK